MGEHIEHLRFYMHALGSATKLAKPGVELVFAERIDQIIGEWFCHGIGVGTLNS